MGEPAPPRNDYAPIHIGGPDEPAKAWIQHRILTIVWEKDVDGTPIKGLRFRVLSPTAATKPPKDKDVEEYVKGLIHGMVDPVYREDTPWDIRMEDMEGGDPNHPRILLLELHKEIDWAFSRDQPGVTHKIKPPADRIEDTNLHFFDSDGNRQLPAGGTPPKGCRFLCWSILLRPRDRNDIAELRGFNFHITMKDSETGKTLPLIFDPNVPDNGGAGIP